MSIEIAAFFDAIRRNDINYITNIIDRYEPIDYITLDDDNRGTTIQYALENESYDIIKLFIHHIHKHYNNQVGDQDDYTFADFLERRHMLEAIFDNGNIELIQLIFSLDPDVLCFTGYKRRFMKYAEILIRKQHYNSIKYLIELYQNRFTTEIIQDIVMYTTAYTNIEFVDYIYTLYPISLITLDRFDNYSIFYAARTGNIQVYQHLLTNCFRNINLFVSNANKENLMHFAAYGNNAEIIQSVNLLFRTNQPPNEFQCINTITRYVGEWKNQQESRKNTSTSIPAIGSIEYIGRLNEYTSPLLIATNENRFISIQTLIQCKANIYCSDQPDQFLHLIINNAIKNNHEILQYVLSDEFIHDWNMNNELLLSMVKQDEIEKLTPTYFNPNPIPLLLESIYNNDGLRKTPLIIAAENNDFKSIQLFLEMGAQYRFNPIKLNVLHYIVKSNNKICHNSEDIPQKSCITQLFQTKTLQHIMNTTLLEQHDFIGNTPLLTAVSTPYRRVVKPSNINPYIQSIPGIKITFISPTTTNIQQYLTPTTTTTTNNNNEIECPLNNDFISDLVHSGAKIEARNHYGQTILHLCLYNTLLSSRLPFLLDLIIDNIDRINNIQTTAIKTTTNKTTTTNTTSNTDQSSSYCTQCNTSYIEFKGQSQPIWDSINLGKFVSHHIYDYGDYNSTNNNRIYDTHTEDNYLGNIYGIISDQKRHYVYAKMGELTTWYDYDDDDDVNNYDENFRMAVQSAVMRTTVGLDEVKQMMHDYDEQHKNNQK